MYVTAPLHSDSSSDKLPIKLEGPTNYNTWCRYVKGALKIKMLVNHIADSSMLPEEKDKLDEWYRQDQRAQGIITLSVNATMLTVLGDDDLSAKQMWDRLATHCRRQDMWRLVDLLRQLTNTRLLDAANVEQHLAAMSDIRTQFVNYGKAIPEWIAALLLLLSVPTDDPHWRCSWPATQRRPRLQQLLPQARTSHPPSRGTACLRPSWPRRASSPSSRRSVLASSSLTVQQWPHTLQGHTVTSSAPPTRTTTSRPATAPTVTSQDT